VAQYIVSERKPLFTQSCRAGDRKGKAKKRVNVDFPVWIIDRLDKEARLLNVPRQSLIKIRIAERLEKNAG